MVTAVSNVNKLAMTKYIATGAADGSVALIDVDNCSVVMTTKVLRIGVVNNYIGV